MSIEAILLGIAQDGGVPQSGCHCQNCRRAWRDPAARQLVACLALVERAGGRCWLIDATPDFREQWHALQEIVPGCALAGIILTHAHVGHYAGLIHLGREMMGARRVPVYATPACAAFLQRHAPWSQLVALGNIQLRLLSPGQARRLGAEGLSALSVTPLPVPHRNEFSDTVGLLVRGPARRLFYCPDVDSWDPWERELRAGGPRYGRGAPPAGHRHGGAAGGAGC
jgi:pyrroloquinoline quinone biosynthesis protein B